MLASLLAAREFLTFGRDIIQLLLEIGRLIKGGNERVRDELEAIKWREQKAGKAAYEASRAAGPRRSN